MTTWDMFDPYQDQGRQLGLSAATWDSIVFAAGQKGYLLPDNLKDSLSNRHGETLYTALCLCNTTGNGKEYFPVNAVIPQWERLGTR